MSQYLGLIQFMGCVPGEYGEIQASETLDDLLAALK